MPLTAGTFLGAYEIRGLEGAGGMGEVYRARDTRLNRDIALKVLPDRFAADPQRLARFTREAHVLASLSHPNIAAVYGVEDSEGGQALVLEWVDGETLEDRISQGPLPLSEAIAIARQIADALDSAHEHGIVHRDLKPANVKIRPDGTVKVLDFGLAKALDPAASGSDVQAPTITSEAAGAVVGTAAYMSPEQARGQIVDKRTDIWAFGCVLYEMVTGRRAFDGADTATTFAGIIHTEPTLDRVPARLRPLIGKCLEKNPRKRLRDVGDAMALVDVDPVIAPSSPAGSRRQWLAWGSAAVFLIAAVVLAVMRFRETAPVVQQVRFQIALPEKSTVFDVPFALSPDGKSLAFPVRNAPAPAPATLWVHSLASGQWKQIATGGAPFWSPDSRFLAFVSDGKLRKMDMASGQSQLVADLTSERYLGATWNADDVILAGSSAGIVRIPATGGAAVAVTTADPSELGHGYPRFLPDGRHFVYLRVSATGAGASGIFLGSIDAKPEDQPATPLLASSVAPQFVRSPGDSRDGYLLFLRDTTLMAQRFDPTRLALDGDAVALAEQVGHNAVPLARFGHFSASDTGVLVYRQAPSQLGSPVWVDRNGRTLSAVVQGPLDRVITPKLSPDARRLALPASGDLWVYDLTGRPAVKLTIDADPSLPLWTPDGSHIVYESTRVPRRLFQVPADVQGGSPQPVSPEGHYHPHAWSPDGRDIIAAVDSRSETTTDIVRLRTRDQGEPQVLVKTRAMEGWGGMSLSPDHRWLAYTSTGTGTQEIWVSPYSDPGAPIRISPNGGRDPLWARNGRELFYLENGKMMSVAIEPGAAFSFKPPVVLFESHYLHPYTFSGTYDVAPDGRFLMIESAASPPPLPPINVVLNWTAGLTARERP